MHHFRAAVDLIVIEETDRCRSEIGKSVSAVRQALRIRATASPDGCAR